MQFTFRLYDNFVEKLQIFKNLVKFRQFADILETFGANAYAVPLRNNAYHMSTISFFCVYERFFCVCNRSIVIIWIESKLVATAKAQKQYLLGLSPIHMETAQISSRLNQIFQVQRTFYLCQQPIWTRPSVCSSSQLLFIACIVNKESNGRSQKAVTFKILKAKVERYQNS